MRFILESLTNFIALAFLVLVPGAAILYANNLKKKVEESKALQREAELYAEKEKTKESIEKLDSSGLADLANSIYKGDGSKH